MSALLELVVHVKNSWWPRILTEALHLVSNEGQVKRLLLLYKRLI